MRQTIEGYHRDDESHWVAHLKCGHQQHVRHDPPLVTRVWVLTEEGRRGRIGAELDCVRCDEAARAVASAVRAACLAAARAAYEDGGIRGLCTEGRWELAVDAIQSLDLEPIFREALRDDGVTASRRRGSGSTGSR